MNNERKIGSLYARRRRLILGLQDFERRAEVYRSAIDGLEAELRTLRQFVPAFKPRKTNPYFTAEEFIRGYYDAVREAEGTVLTIDDVVIILMRSKGLTEATLVAVTSDRPSGRVLLSRACGASIGCDQYA
jgi:hypothetical protein